MAIVGNVHLGHVMFVRVAFYVLVYPQWQCFCWRNVIVGNVSTLLLRLVL